MRRMEIGGKTGRCEILVGEPISRLAEYCKAEKAAIITDGSVRKLHGSSFPDYPVIEIGRGEAEKTLATVEGIYRRFMEFGLDRQSVVVGIGGGIVCDVAGFAAATYLRGVRFGFVPTTLVAMTDAAVGGKNGVNFEGYKNLIGTIRQPDFVLCDFGLLSTLPPLEIRCGFAETIKHAAIADAQLFAYLEGHLGEAMALKKSVIEKVMHDSLSVKAVIVSADESESGERRKLNFGHTFGHALERMLGMPHGEAVSAGMCIDARISVKKGMCAKEDAERLVALLEKAGLPTEVPAKAKGRAKEMMDAIRKDKKRKSEAVGMALLEGIGKAKVCEVKMAELEAVANDLC